MKIEVTYTIGLDRSVSTVIEVSAESIADVLKDDVFNEIYEKVKSKKEKVVVHGYVSKIEDVD